MTLINLRNIMVMVIFVKAIPFGPNQPILVSKLVPQDLEWWHSGGWSDGIVGAWVVAGGGLSGGILLFQWWREGALVVVYGVEWRL